MARVSNLEIENAMSEFNELENALLIDELDRDHRNILSDDWHTEPDLPIDDYDHWDYLDIDNDECYDEPFYDDGDTWEHLDSVHYEHLT